jgi:hypothetical protein
VIDGLDARVEGSNAPREAGAGQASHSAVSEGDGSGRSGTGCARP